MNTWSKTRYSTRYGYAYRPLHERLEPGEWAALVLALMGLFWLLFG